MIASLYLMDEQGDCSLVKAFGYQDFKRDYHDRNSEKAGYRMSAEYEPIMAPHDMADRPGSWPFHGKAAKRAFSQIIKTIAEGETVYLLVSRIIHLKPNPI